MSLYMFFGILWLCAFFRYTANFVCMVAASSYYFNSSASKEGEAEVQMAFKFAHVNHAGSIALGSFIIALIQLIRFLFIYVAK
jgi:choline transporter-like protein 2/4/5